MQFFSWIWAAILSWFGIHKPHVCIFDIHHNIECYQSQDDLLGNIDMNIRAWVFYDERVNETGWAQLEITTNPKILDNDQAYAAGYLEGHLTWKLIQMQWFNLMDDFCAHADCDMIEKLIVTNKKFVNKMIEENNAADPFWHQVGLIYKQIEGMQDGYEKAEDGKEKLKVNMFWMSLLSELTGDLKTLFNGLDSDPSIDHCSALVKPLTDGSDLYVAHNTFVSYSYMIRIIKKYNFGYNQTLSKDEDSSENNVVAAQSIAFPSYPGAVHSFDDYYITSAKLVVQETTNAHHNKKAMLANIRPDNTVFKFIRNMVANRLATNGKEWTEIFARYDSATCSNQFMIIDYNKFEPGMTVDKLADGLLWVAESVPGLAHAEDMTDLLRKKGYWASYNTPYFEDIRKAGGFTEMEEKLGDYYSHENTARAQLFKRGNVNVTDMKSLYTLMRYNDFKNDLLSTCEIYGLKCNPPYSAWLAIAARNDLNQVNGTYQLDILGHRFLGAIDVKMTNHELVKELKMYAESGPTRTQQPMFDWSKVNDKNIRHLGQVEKFEFPTMAIKWLPQESVKFEL